MGRILSIAVLIPGIFSIATSSAQVAPTWDSEQQSKVISTLKSMYADVDPAIVQWEQNDQGNYYGAFRYNDRDMMITFNNQGNWMNTSETIPLQDLPRNFYKRLIKKHTDEEISSVHRITNSTDNICYDVFLKGQEGKLRYDSNGRQID